jgi:hypothetical protein
MNTPLINRTAVREFSMVVLHQERPHLADKFTRVSEEWFEKIESRLRVAIVQEIRASGTTGKTLKPA